MQARLSSAQEISDRAPTRWDVINQVLSNKKAMDVAFQQHVWEQQRQAADLAGGKETAQIHASSAEKIAGMRGPSLKYSPAEQAREDAKAWALQNFIDLSTPEGQAQYENTFQNLLQLYQMQGGSGQGYPTQQGAQNLAAGATSTPAAMPTGMGGPLAAFRKARPSGSPVSQPGRAPQSSPGEVTATNPKTGQQLVWRNGSWQPR